uniref:Lipase domain-containing protein n=1 Tax=Romanomermis culicivorax TaxID=13658 RepID=A0A915L6G1_ROMCU
MDPAGPLFACEDKATRLDPSDAKFVQVVHTNGESFLNGGLGTPERMGHVDFYPNGGQTQPGCPRSLVGKIAKKVATFDFSSLKDVSCSHSTAPLIVTDILRRSTSTVKSSKDACRFQTFACPNGKDWKWGRCFRRCQNSTQCPVPGLDLLFATTAKQPQQQYQQKIYFNTLARNNETDSPEFCGRQHLVTITSPSGAKGSIRLRLYDQKFGWSNQSKFQRSSHKLKKDIPRSEVIVSEWKIEDVSKIELNYTRYKNKILANGPMWFNLTNVTVEEASGLL